MTSGRHRIFVGKDTHKFSSAHMTVFADGTKERLHGHNFQVSVALDLTSRGVEHLVDLAIVKRAVVDQCGEWDQRLLLAAMSPQMQGLRQDSVSCEFTLCGRRYVVPAEEVLLLPVRNVTVETLSELFARSLLERLGPSLPAGSTRAIEVSVTESRNQGGTFVLELG